MTTLLFARMSRLVANPIRPHVHPIEKQSNGMLQLSQSIERNGKRSKEFHMKKHLRKREF
jgi:hypothetical protein